MQIQELKIAQFRGINQASLTFKPGMNLIVGINGVGKTSVLDCIRVLLSHIMPKVTVSTRQPIYFKQADIMVNRPLLVAEIKLNNVNNSYESIALLKREESEEEPLYLTNIIDKDGNKITNKKLIMSFKEFIDQPIAVYYSTSRSVSQNTKYEVTPKQLPFSQALIKNRELNLKIFEDWWRTREEVAVEAPQGTSAKQLESVRQALGNFLSDFSNLRLENGKLTIDKKQVFVVEEEVREELISLEIAQLSEGEKSVIALVVDLSRRIAQANPKLENPARDGKGLVLIDEIELHLHPGWQRNIVERLEQTFPNCQFIATTHSPQVIGEVSADKVLILKPGKQPRRPPQAFGMDSNWILRHLMGGDDRDPKIAKRIDKIFDNIEENKFEEAGELASKLRTEIGNHPDLVEAEALITRYTRFSSDEVE